MAVKHRKKILAIEWVWLIIGTAVIVVHMVESWSAPYVPSLWMLAMVALFVVYRAGWAIRELYWPAPEPEPADAPARSGLFTPRRRGGDGRVSTTEWVPPHIRGRSIPQKRGERRKQGAGEAQLAIPSGDGQFEDGDIATVFAQVDEETDPLGAGALDVRIDATMIVELDNAELRPETDADMSSGEVVIPAFAESGLSRDERERAMTVLHRTDASAAEVDEPTQPAAAADKTLPELAASDTTQPVVQAETTEPAAAPADTTQPVVHSPPNKPAPPADADKTQPTPARPKPPGRANEESS